MGVSILPVGDVGVFGYPVFGERVLFEESVPDSVLLRCLLNLVLEMIAMKTADGPDFGGIPLDKTTI